MGDNNFFGRCFFLFTPWVYVCLLIIFRFFKINYAICWLIGIIMGLHIILYNLISILLLVLAILCFILIKCFLLGHTVLNSHLLDAYVATFCQFSFFNLSLSGFGGLFCIIVGILHLIFVQFAYLFCHLILHFSGFVSHCWWFCALFIYCYGISFVHYGGSHMLNCLSFCQFCCFVCFSSLLRYMIASLWHSLILDPF